MIGGHGPDRAPESHPAPRFAVLGLGNVLMGDDALGPYVVQLLAAGHEFAADVAVLDVGTPGLDLTPFVAGLDGLILVDTVHATAPPGTVRHYRRDDVLRHAPPQRVSPHDPGVRETLLSLEFAGQAPRELLLVGVVPADTGMRTGLSAPVRDAIPAVLEAVLAELNRLGRPAHALVTPRAPDLWWEAVP